jgi:hypothetical protein
MSKSWSISTTVRNPERLRDFLKVLKKLEGQPFDTKNQIKYQVLLIKERLYKPNNIPSDFNKYYEDPEEEFPEDIAKKIFDYQGYQDPPMRGRQSVNPLNKLGFSIAREGFGPIIITELGNKFLAGDYDIGNVFFKSLLKLQFPNPWSTDFSEKEGFNIMPFIGAMHLIYRLNKNSDKKGLDKTEFCVFIPTLISFRLIDEYVRRILEFRRTKNKENYLIKFVKDFYETNDDINKKLNNLFDYGDNIMRYFRLTRYFKLSMDPLGYHWTIDLEPTRKVEIEQLLDMYSGEAINFSDRQEYLDYLADINKPILPWEKKEKLLSISESLKNMIVELINKENLKITKGELEVLNKELKMLNKSQLEDYVDILRRLKLELNERLKKVRLLNDLNRIEEIILALRDSKQLRKYEPEQFEKLLTEALKIINDEISIRPNYPVDDNGEPVSHSPGGKPDIECLYKTFKAICEVTLNNSRLQWVQEGQPIMRHLREFEKQNPNDQVFCIFIAPRIHKDTYSQFWFSVKYEYYGQPQKIIPLTAEQFSFILETLLNLIKQGKRFSHKELYKLYFKIINESKNLKSCSDWEIFINKAIQEWQKCMVRT